MVHWKQHSSAHASALLALGFFRHLILHVFAKDASCFAKDWQVRPNEVVFGTLVNSLGTSLKWMYLDKSSLSGICVCHRVAPTSHDHSACI